MFFAFTITKFRFFLARDTYEAPFLSYSVKTNTILNEKSIRVSAQINNSLMSTLVYDYDTSEIYTMVP